MSTRAATDSDAATQWRISPLELLHPDGFASRPLIIGSQAPLPLLPGACVTSGGPFDLVLLAPAHAECEMPGWLEDAVRRATRSLASDAVVYVLAPQQWRHAISRLLREHSMSIEAAFAHLPDSASSRYIVPLHTITIRYALSKVIPARSSVRRAAAMALSLPGSGRLLGVALPSVALVARPSGARPLFSWVFQLGGQPHLSGRVVLSTRWRAEHGSAVLHRFSGSERLPSTVIKLPLTASMVDRRLSEAAILERLGPMARKAGARAPAISVVERRSGHPMLLQRALHGQSLATLLASQRWCWSDAMEPIIQWLERWNRSTVVIKAVDAQWLEREILGPARLLAPGITGGHEYVEWLRVRCAEVSGAPLPRVAAHNDLTMWNVLLDDERRLCVVDWESARPDGFPLADFYYAVTDAVAAAGVRRGHARGGYADRLEAFEACFAPGGAHSAAVASFEARMRSAVSVPPRLESLAFHACWLHHAANERERKKDEPGSPRPFLKILQWMVSHHPDLERRLSRYG
jgi:Phosphotransferase enzyme family